MAKTGRGDIKVNERFLTCGLCNQWFTQPRTLPCLHSYCENCLSKHIHDYIAKSSVKKGSQTAHPTEYVCPTCNKAIDVSKFSSQSAKNWTTKFPLNTFLMDLLDVELLMRGEKTCGPCTRNGDRSDVVSWCKECRDGLCKNCSKVHRGMRVSMDHTVLSKEEFMKHVSLLQEQQEPCQKHPGKTLDMYCMTDRELCCPNCVAEEHRRCDRVVSVMDAVKQSRLDKTPEFLKKNLEEYNEHIEKVIAARTNKLLSLDEQKTKLIDEFSQIRINVINILDKMEKAIKKELSDIHSGETKAMEKEVSKSRKIQSAVTNAHELLNVTENHGSDSNLMKTIEEVKRECLWYEEEMGKLRSKIQDCEYVFEIDEHIETLLNKVKKYGELKVRHSPSKLQPFPNTVTIEKSIEQGKQFKSTLSLKGRKAELAKAFDAKMEDDIKDCWYTGAAFLSDGRFVLVDRSNRKLKLFSKNYRLLNSIFFTTKPWDVTVVGENEIAVTLPEEHGIQLLTTGDSIKMSDYFTTEEACFGIKHVRGKFFALCYDGKPPALKVISSDGRELAAIGVDDDGSPLFSRPIYVTSNNAGTVIYVSDERRGCITCLTETSEHCYTYSTIDLSHVAGITLDREGNLYVCRNHAKSVQVVSPEGDRIKTIVSREEITYPRAIAYDEKEDRLLITQGDKSVVKIFHFE